MLEDCDYVCYSSLREKCRARKSVGKPDEERREKKTDRKLNEGRHERGLMRQIRLVEEKKKETRKTSICSSAEIEN